MDKEIIYIAGLYHSGSTLLDQYIGSNDSIIGLGEICKFIKDGPAGKCTCGASADKCEFWKEFKPLKNISESEIEKTYSNIFKKACKKEGKFKYILDSSKCHPYNMKPIYSNFRGLIYYTKYFPNKLRIIHLYRDPRSWVSSIMRREKRSRRKFIISTIFKSEVMRAVRYCQWFFMHFLIRKFIRENNLRSINISYENICLDKKNSLNKISKFLNLELDEKTLNLKETNSHICVGNPSRLTNIENPEIKYDTRWLKEKFTFVDYLFSKILKKQINNFIFKNSRN